MTTSLRVLEKSIPGAIYLYYSCPQHWLQLTQARILANTSVTPLRFNCHLDLCFVIFSNQLHFPHIYLVDFANCIGRIIFVQKKSRHIPILDEIINISYFEIHSWSVLFVLNTHLLYIFYKESIAIWLSWTYFAYEVKKCVNYVN